MVCMWFVCGNFDVFPILMKQTEGILGSFTCSDQGKGNATKIDIKYDNKNYFFYSSCEAKESTDRVLGVEGFPLCFP